MRKRRVPRRGFTLLEVLIAMAIATAALVVLLQRVGISSDTQQSLSIQSLALATAIDVLERGRLQPLAQDERHGLVEIQGLRLSWTTRVEKTDVPGFVRQNVEVSVPGGQSWQLFLYRNVP